MIRYLRLVNISFTAAAVAIFLLFLASYWTPYKISSGRKFISFQAKDMIPAAWKGADYQKQDEAHLSAIANKRLFKIPEELKPKNIQPIEDRKDFLQDINLVGIMDDQGRKAILEDKKTSKTYYLSTGDNISGMKISEIKDKEVVLEKDGTDYSLVL